MALLSKANKPAPGPDRGPARGHERGHGREHDQALLAEIARLAAALEAVVDAEVARTMKEAALSGGQESCGIPEGVVRQLVTRNDSCLCRVVQRLIAEAKQQAAGG